MHEGIGRLFAPAVTGAPDEALSREFERLLAESSTLAFRVAFGVLRHREDAEDVAQEACTRAYTRFHQLREKDRFRAWLVRMTWRLALDRARAERTRTLRQREAAPPAASDPAVGERAAQLWQAIDRLPDKLRLAIVLAGIEGHDVRAVAVLLGVPEGTVKSRLFSARQRLKEWLSCPPGNPASR